MIGFITDKDNDFMLDDFGNIKVSEGIDAYRQNLVNRIKLQQFEYPYDVLRGLNYMGYLFQTYNVVAWESQLLELVNNTSFVKNIENWEYEVKEKNFMFTLVVNTDLGKIEIRG